MLLSLLPAAVDPLWMSSLAAVVAAPYCDTADTVERNVTLLTRESEIAALEKEWAELSDVTTGPVPFHTFEWSKRAAGAGARAGIEPIVIVVGSPDRPRLIMPLAHARLGPCRVLRWLGEPVAQYGDVLASPHADAADVAVALDAARGTGADLIWLRRVRDDSALARLSAGGRLQSAGGDEAPSVTIGLAPGRPEPSAKAKRQRRAALRKLEAIGPIRFEVLEGEAARGMAREAIALKRAWLSERGLERSPLFDPVWAACLSELSGEAGGVVTCLTIGGRPASIEIGFVHRGHYAAFLGCFHPDFAQAAPGKIHTDMMLEHCAEHGISTYDFLAPADPYKMRWATRSVAISDQVMPLSLLGRAAFATVRARPWLKALQARVPVGMRRNLARAMRGV